MSTEVLCQRGGQQGRTVYKHDMSKAFETFKSKNLEFPYSQRTFEMLWPPHVQLSNNDTRARFCCLIHVAADLLVTALKEAHKRQGLETTLKTAGGMLRFSYCDICNDAPFHKKEYILRYCAVSWNLVGYGYPFPSECN